MFIINFTILGFSTNDLLKGAIASVGTVVSSFRSNDNQRLTDQVLAAYNLIGLNDQQLKIALSNMRVPGQEEFASFIHIKDASVIFHLSVWSAFTSRLTFKLPLGQNRRTVPEPHLSAVCGFHSGEDQLRTRQMGRFQRRTLAQWKEFGWWIQGQ
jgi:hypothetical protein